MAGHSQFANIRHRKAAQDKKRSGHFTKLIREIVVAAKKGLPDPDFNPRLRAAMQAARKASVPRDRIENAIKKATGSGDTEQYEDMRYEGYGPCGVAVIIESLTDNRNRTASEIRSLFNKHGGALGESGSVNFLFDRVGLIHYERVRATPEAIFEAALEAGADNCESGMHGHEVTCAPDAFNDVRTALEAAFGEPETAGLTWRPKTMIPLDKAAAEQVLKFIETLEENDDVQNVFANYDISDAVALALQS